MYPWIKVFHVFAVIAWFAGIFYLPRLFVYHAMSDDKISRDRFKVMERKLLWGIMTPSAVIAVLLGTWLWLGYGFSGTWLTVKITLVGVLLAYHGWCIKVTNDFKADKNNHGHTFYRWMNELPVFLLLAILAMVIVKPF
ncbi:MAG: CopD family protein [Arenicellales bacterium]